MSQLADFHLVRRTDLPGLVEAARPARKLFRKPHDRFPEALASAGRELGVHDWGYHFVVALVRLDEQGVPIMDSGLEDAATAIGDGQEMTALIFVPEQRAHLARLDPAANDEGELRRYYEEFTETTEPEAGAHMLEALGVLHGHLASLDDDSVLLVLCG